MEDDDVRKQRQTFFADLETFYRKKWNCHLKTPNFNGRPVDLFRLYQRVTALGGWAKVSVANKWHDVCQEVLSMPTKCYGVEHGLKMIYMRYLARYQQQQMFGDDHEESMDVGTARTSRRGGNNFLTTLPPFFGKPNPISDILRNSGGYAIDLVERSAYDRLLRSLESGLSNEVDLAVNVCLLMSASTNSATVASKYAESSTLLDLLLAHVGFFDEGFGSYRSLYEGSWRKQSGEMKFVEFWREMVDDDDEDVAHLLDVGAGSIERASIERTSPEERRLFNLTHQMGAQNHVAQRVLQIGNIIRNLSFESRFREVLVSHRTAMNYVLVCINSKIANLQALGWDILSNLATQLSLDPMESPITQVLFRTLNKSLNCRDKFRIIRALETIANLCGNERNETLLCEFLEPNVIRRLIALLAVKDIMMCVHLLECLYSISEMGRITCQRVAEQPKAIDMLVSLVTVEAVSFGTNGLMGMKVVEFGVPQSHTAILPQPYRTHTIAAANDSTSETLTSNVAPTMPSTAPAVLGNRATSLIGPQVNKGLMNSAPPPFMAKPIHMPVSSTSSPIKIEEANCKGKAKKSGGKKVNEKLATPISTAPSTSLNSAPSTSFRGPAVMLQQDQQSELVASNWLKQNCAVDPQGSLSRGELYTSYVQHVSSSASAVSVNTFATLIRQTFPSCQFRQVESSNCKTPMVYVDGLKHFGTNSHPNQTQKTNSANSPVASQHPLTQMILSQKPQFSPAAAPCASPTLSGAASPAVRSVMGGRCRSDSFCTGDSYSLPATPESSMSSATNYSSSTAPTNFGPASPRSNKTTKKASKKKKKNGIPGSALPVLNETATPTTNTNTNCQLDVCHPAQEAQAVIETGDNHEALILRIENSTTPSSTTNDSHQPQKPLVNGRATSLLMDSSGETSPENSRQSITSSESQSYQMILQAPTSIVVSLLNKSTPKAALNLNGLVKQPTVPDAVHSVVTACHANSAAPHTNGGGDNSRTQSPSPDMETIKQNLQLQQENIQQLLMTEPSTNSNASVGDAVDDDDMLDPVKAVVSETMVQRRLNASLQEDGVETTPKKKVRKKYPKKKPASAGVPGGLVENGPPLNFAEFLVAETPKKGKKAAKRAAAMDGNETPSKKKKTASNSNNCSTPLTNHVTATATQNNCVTNTTLDANFRPPLPPSTTPMQYVSGIVGAGQMIVRVATPAVAPVSLPKLKYQCEWENCDKSFDTATAVAFHAAKLHILADLSVSCCRWTHCDKTPRLTWSLIAHVQDVHCNERLLRAAAVRRYEISISGRSNIPENKSPPPHPGYPPDAALAAIRRHSLVGLPKDITEENEGPVTKSIRLASCLTLRNLARYSSEGRRLLRNYETMLSWLAMSRLESSAALAQCLAELHAPASPEMMDEVENPFDVQRR